MRSRQDHQNVDPVPQTIQRVKDAVVVLVVLIVIPIGTERVSFFVVKICRQGLARDGRVLRRTMAPTARIFGLCLFCSRSGRSYR
jgi:hypothetical protein